VLLEKEEMVLQGRTDRLTETGRCSGMEMSVKKTRLIGISRQLSAVQIVIGQIQPDYVEYFNYLGRTLTSNARFARTDEIISRVSMPSITFNNKKAVFTSKVHLHLRKKPVKCYIWSTALCGAETWRLRKVEQKYVGSFEMWCWRRMEKISWTDRVGNEEVLHRVKGERNILLIIHRRKANWIGHVLLMNCFLKHVIEGKIEEKDRSDGKTMKKT
jgi:hypothetical protein